MFSVIGYDKIGSECNAEDDISVAKKSIDEILNTEKFWIKICTNGINSGKFFDPSTNMLEELKRFDSYTGKLRYSYKLVNKECFELYLNYLKTKNNSFLKNAERMM
jgi:hypothetical protein